jgi:acetylglutamate kinase
MRVIKIGGRELARGPALERLLAFLRSSLWTDGPGVLVHGGGDEVTERARELGVATARRDGLRVTSPAMLEVVVEVLAGRVNTRLVVALESAGIPAVGLAGPSAGVLTVVPSGDPAGSLGAVGRPSGVNARLLRMLTAEGMTPVVAPIGVDADGNLYNVNADDAAAAIASALHAELLLVTDVDGVQSRQGERFDHLSLRGLRRCLDDGTARGGMIPKLEAVGRALREGVPEAWIGPPAALAAASSSPQGGTWLGRVPKAPPVPPSLPRSP